VGYIGGKKKKKVDDEEESDAGVNIDADVDEDMVSER
jgi:hypothetical protein